MYIILMHPRHVNNKNKTHLDELDHKSVTEYQIEKGNSELSGGPGKIYFHPQNYQTKNLS